MYSGKVLQHTAQGEELAKFNDEWYTSVRPLHAKCPPQQSEQPEDRANEQGHWQFRSNWMNCWKMFMLFYSFCIFHLIFWNVWSSGRPCRCILVEVCKCPRVKPTFFNALKDLFCSVPKTNDTSFFVSRCSGSDSVTNCAMNRLL